MARGFRLTSPVVKLVERDVTQGCVDILHLKGFMPIRLPVGLYKTPDGKRWIQIGEKGMPDYVVPEFFVEVKRPGGELGDDQRRKIAEIEQIWRIPVAVVDSVDALAEWLKLRAQGKQ